MHRAKRILQDEVRITNRKRKVPADEQSVRLAKRFEVVANGGKFIPKQSD